MTFVNPLLLLAALGIGLPILAHLLNRFKVKHTDWAAMQFLNRSIRVRSRQLRLRDLLLLLLRCLAILLLVLAVSKPSMEGVSGVAAELGERRAGVVIALDASYSMQHRDGAASRFERAVTTVEAIAEDILPGAPVSLILLGDEHRVVVRNMAYDAERFGAVLREQSAAPEALTLDTVPDALARLVNDMQAIQKEVYIVTDMQTRDWGHLSPWLLGALEDLNVAADTFVVPVQGTAENLSVTSFELFSGLLRKGTIARYKATVHNHDTTPVTRVRVKCLMDGMNVDSKTIPTINGRSSQTVSFFVPFHNAGSVKLSAKLEEDALPLDNERRAVANVRGRVSILCVEGKAYGNSVDSFIAKALRARGGGAAKEDFRVTSVSWLSLPSQDLNAFDLVILSDVPEITAQQALQLGDYVRAGNGLIWFGGGSVKVATWNERAALEKGSLLPALIGDIETVSDAMGKGLPLDPILPNHPICRPLRSLPKDLLSETQVHNLMGVTPLPSSSAILNLAGSATPVLLEHRMGRGHVFMFTTSSTPAWNNMALTPVFPMLLQQMVTYLTGREFETAQTVGNALSLSYADRPDANDAVFETPAGDIIRVPVREHAGQFVAFLDHAREAGFYTARVSVQSPGQPIAVNVNTTESDVRCLEPATAETVLAGTGVRVAESTIGLLDEVRTGYAYWRSLLIAGLVVLLLESLLASNLFRGTHRRAQGDAGGTA